MTREEMAIRVAARMGRHRYWTPGTCECGQWTADRLGHQSYDWQWKLHVANDLLDFVESRPVSS